MGRRHRLYAKAQRQLLNDPLLTGEKKEPYTLFMSKSSLYVTIALCFSVAAGGLLYYLLQGRRSRPAKLTEEDRVATRECFPTEKKCSSNGCGGASAGARQPPVAMHPDGTSVCCVHSCFS